MAWTELAEAAGVVVAVLCVLAYALVLRRRRARHAALVRAAFAGMCELLDGEATPLRRLQRDLVEVLIGQDALAERLEWTVRPVVVAAGDGPLDRFVLADIVASGRMATVADPDELLRRVLASEVDVVPDNGGLGFPEPDPEAGEDTEDSEDVAVGPIGPVPRVVTWPALQALHASMCETTGRQVRLAGGLVWHAASVGEPVAEYRDRLIAALSRAADAESASRSMAGTDVLGALRALTAGDLPVPEDGVPGQAVRRELWAQAYGLARVASIHRAEVSWWCAESLRRCGYVPAGTEGSVA